MEWGHWDSELKACLEQLGAGNWYLARSPVSESCMALRSVTRQVAQTGQIRKGRVGDTYERGQTVLEGPLSEICLGTSRLHPAAY